MKTKFIKVSVSERLPNKEIKYFVWVDNPNAQMYESEKDQQEYNMDKKYFKEGEFKSFYDVTDYLIEVPDREEEMREILNEARTVIARMKRSMLVHPDHKEGSEFDDLTTSAQEIENQIGEYLTN
jgi:hypothetical protein